jgi:TetR/AcrR family transcriptional regulator, transcriptional repressor for nem operon
MLMSELSPTANDILDCAQTLIMAGGYNGFSYADIAEVVGIRKASIHHHFPTKAELVRTLVARYRGEARNGLIALDQSGTDPRQKLSLYIAYWQRCLIDGSAPICICALLASEVPVLPPEVAAEVRQHFQSLSRWLETTLEQGKSDAVLTLSRSAADEAEAFMATVHGGMLSARISHNPELFTTITDTLLRRFFP